MLFGWVTWLHVNIMQKDCETFLCAIKIEILFLTLSFPFWLCRSCCCTFLLVARAGGCPLVSVLDFLVMLRALGEASVAVACGLKQFSSALWSTELSGCVAWVYTQGTWDLPEQDQTHGSSLAGRYHWAARKPNVRVLPVLPFA